MDSYSAPITQQQFELIIKRSRFVTTVERVGSKPAGRLALEAVRAAYPDANHHCWAMVAGHPEDVYVRDQSDDGEPKGTAGKPMLNVLLHANIGNILVVVTRYFGGVKLGAGGLVRAYTQSVVQAMDQLNTETVFVTQCVRCFCPYPSLAILEHAIQSTNIQIVDKQFSDKLLLELAIPESELPWFVENLARWGAEIVESGNTEH